MILLLGILLSICQSALCQDTYPDQNCQNQKVDTDRWLEIDLYWFDKDNINSSVDTFWQRYSPLMENVQGWRGVILNVGWLLDYVLEWKSDFSQQIPIPQNMEQHNWTKMQGPVKGTIEQKKQQWKQRFENPIPDLKKYYQDWTYQDLRDLVRQLKVCSAQKYNIPDLKVGSLILGWKRAYKGDHGIWAKKHPEIYTKDGVIMGWGCFIPGASLKADANSYAAFPNGIKEGTPAYEFFAAQWGHLSKSIGLNAIVLRDSTLISKVYERKGPYGQAVTENKKQNQFWHNSGQALVKFTKMANPDALVIGYASAVSAVSDWRCSGIDLETIAEQGFMDAFVEHNWGAGTNELAQREAFFWNRPPIGWTYEFAHNLVHGAILAQSDVRRYHLAETFDAWEEFDAIHGARDRMQWSMWANLHAAVKTPSGLKMPCGSYISWCNQGKRLLDKEDVAFIRNNLNQAVIDAQNTTKVFGPTLVYSRNAVKWLMENSPQSYIKEFIGEHAGSLMKWPVGISSATRVEWLDSVDSDLPIIQTPVHLSDEEERNVTNAIKSKTGAAIFASPSGGVDPDIARLIGLDIPKDTELKLKHQAYLSTDKPKFAQDIPDQFTTDQPLSAYSSSDTTHVLYRVENSPALFTNTSNKMKSIFWDPPEMDYSTNISTLKVLGGSVYPYVLTARAINDFLSHTDCPRVELVDPNQALFASYWQLKDGSFRILIANLEESIRFDSDLTRKIEITIPDSWFKGKDQLSVKDIWKNKDLGKTGKALDIKIEEPRSILLSLN